MNSASSPQIIEHLSSSVNCTPFACCWIPQSSRIAVLGENPRRTGAISIYKLNVQTKKLELQHNETLQYGQKCGTFGLSTNEQGSQQTQRLLATGDFNGNVSIWDIERLDTPLYQVKGHEKIINAIDACGNGYNNKNMGAPEIVTGSRDGTVKVWDPRTKDAVVTLQPTKLSANDKNNNNKQNRDCWAVAFGNCFDANNRCIVSGYDNGDLKFLDLKMNKLYWETNLKNGVVSCEFDRQSIKQNKLLVTTLESKYFVFDMRTQHVSEGFAYLAQNGNDGSTIWQGKHLPQNRDLWCTCGGNGSVNIWKYNYPSERSINDDKGNKKGVMGEIELLAEQKIGTQPITSWNWSTDKIGLACCVALDQTVKVIFTTKLQKY